MLICRPRLRVLLFVFISVLSSGSLLLGQNPFVSSTPGQDFIITSQAQLDNFQNASGKYTSSDVGITLDGTSTTFTDLGNLSELTRVEGLLEIIGWGTDDTGGSSDPLSAFTSLTEVRELHVGRDVGNNEGMTSITSATLTAIQNRIEMIRCINATTVSIPNVASVSGNVFIDSLTAATVLDFSGLTTVGGKLQIEECRSLPDLNGFRFVETIGTILSILRNDLLQNVDDLGRAVPAGRPVYSLRRLIVRGNPLITNLASLTCSISEDIVLVNNGQLTELGPIDLQTNMERLEIGRHDNLTNLSQILAGTDVLTLKRFIFYRNAGYTATASRPIRVETELTLDQLDITTLFDFSATTDISARLNVLGNPNLTDLGSLGNLTTAGRVTIENNNALATLDDLASLSTVTEAAFITDNAALGDCCLFPEQVSVAGAPANSSNPNFIVSNNTGTCTDNTTVDNNCSASALPVSWYAVSAEWATPGVRIEWKTAAEDYNELFRLERSTDGTHFTDLATIPARGNTGGIRTYSCYDRKPAAGPTLYYRIRQQDYDGAYSYSEVVTVDRTATAPRVYPNPSGGRPLRIVNDADRVVEVSLYDSLGRLRYRGESNREVPIAGLPAGRYLIRTSGPYGISSQPVILLR